MWPKHVYVTSSWIMWATNYLRALASLLLHNPWKLLSKRTTDRISAYTVPHLEHFESSSGLGKGDLPRMPRVVPASLTTLLDRSKTFSLVRVLSAQVRGTLGQKNIKVVENWQYISTWTCFLAGQKYFRNRTHQTLQTSLEKNSPSLRLCASSARALFL